MYDQQQQDNGLRVSDAIHPSKKRLNGFDKVCCCLAFLLGVVFILLGAIGLFTGCRAHFTLPPILGGIPVLAGWGIVKAIYVAW